MKLNRRSLIRNGFLSSAALLALPLKLNAQLCPPGKTPPQVEGPFYPIIDQVDKDADLVQVTGALEPAKGEIVIVQGIVTDQDCRAVSGALVEIWQACESGRYNHPSDPNTAPIDPNFQYWGKAVTNDLGFYRFRTIIPGAYPATDDWMRPPHIHFKIARLGYLELITQMYFKGDPLNDQDLILKRLKKSDQSKVVVDFRVAEDTPHPIGDFNIQIEKL